MQKKCVNNWCNTSFEITDEDVSFYEKVSPVINGKKYQIPKPTLCPDCRQQRRYAIRNERKLFKSNCDNCDQNMLCMYDKGQNFPVYCPGCWWGDKWDATLNEIDISFDQSFFQQYSKLINSVPRIGSYVVNSDNCDYCNFVGDCNRCYLSFGSVYSEDCLYGSAYYSKDCVDNLVTRECELCYECVDCRKLYNCLNCQDCYDSNDLLLCYDMQGCSECIACAGLRNKKYFIANKSYSKTDYFNKKKEIDLSCLSIKEEFEQMFDLVKEKTIRNYMPSGVVENASGSHIYNSKNINQSFYVDRCEDCAYCMQVVDLKDCYDNNYTEENELCYEYLGMYNTKQTCFSSFSRHAYFVLYSEYCINSSYLFGCIGLKNKKYCILNKQYTKEEYEELIPRIIEYMKKTGEWGEFFPIRISPFAYNESVAQEYFPLTKEEVLQRNWSWIDQKEEILKVEKTIPAFRLPESIDDIPDDILNWAIECDVTKRPFRIIKQELDFYRRMHLPIPHLHPDERHKRRMSLRNPRNLWDRTCDKCSKEIKTTYAPERPETVFCEDCYLKEVY
jgi:hypothetical protein